MMVIPHDRFVISPFRYPEEQKVIQCVITRERFEPACATHLMSFSCERNCVARLFVTCRALFCGVRWNLTRSVCCASFIVVCALDERGAGHIQHMFPHVQLLAGTVRGWASLIFFLVCFLALVQGRAGVQVLCFFFVWTFLKRVVSSSACERVDQSDNMRRDKQIGRYAGQEETRLCSQ